MNNQEITNGEIEAKLSADIIEHRSKKLDHPVEDGLLPCGFCQKKPKVKEDERVSFGNISFGCEVSCDCWVRPRSYEVFDVEAWGGDADRCKKDAREYAVRRWNDRKPRM